MPPKNDKMIKNDKGNEKEFSDAEKRMKALIEGYDRLCRQFDIGSYQPLRRLMKTNLEEGKLQTQFLFDPVDREKTIYWEDETLPDIFNKENEHKPKSITKMKPPLVKVGPLLNTIRDTRYIFIQELLVWGVKIDFDEVLCLAYLLSRKVYHLVRLELIDCLLDEMAMTKIIPTVNKCPTLRDLVLDCNEFGDDGCQIICQELNGCSFLYQLSLNHCGITQDSCRFLGELISGSTIRELFLEGNCLENEGVIILVGIINNSIMQQQFSKEEDKIEIPSQKMTFNSIDVVKEDQEVDLNILPVKKKKVKKQKTNKLVMLPKGPDICKLNIANNNIGRFGIGDHFAPVFSMQLLKRLIFTCKDLEEIDLFANDIGDISARLILEGLAIRKGQKYPQMGIRMCHLINQDIFESITKLAPGSKKKKKRSAR